MKKVVLKQTATCRSWSMHARHILALLTVYASTALLPFLFPFFLKYFFR